MRVALSDKGCLNVGGRITTSSCGGSSRRCRRRPLAKPAPSSAASQRSLTLVMKPASERRPAGHSPHGLSVSSGDAILFREVIVQSSALLIFAQPREPFSRVADSRMPDMTNSIIASLVLAIERVDRDHEADVFAAPAAKTFVHSPSLDECLSRHDLN